jgi:hypothetical protein
MYRAGSVVRAEILVFPKQEKGNRPPRTAEENVVAIKNTLTLLVAVIIASLGLSLSPAFAATPGTWVGTAGFGTFELVLNAEGTRILILNYNFSNGICGPGTFVDSGSIEGNWRITNDSFSIYTPGFEKEMTLAGTFNSATQASGTYQATIQDVTCNGVWEATIDGGVDPEPFTINAGHSGAWFNPDTSGQGQLIDVEPESTFMFLSWFTFTDTASSSPNEQHWFTAQGNYAGNTADLVVYETLGGRFDDPQAVSTEPVGAATLSFTDCGLGEMNYTIDTWDLHGSFPLHRAIPEKRAGISTEPLDLNDGWDGAWYDDETPGQGFLIDAQPNAEGDDFIFVAWFTYGENTASGQRWLTAQGPLEGTTADLVVYGTEGGSFDDPKFSETNAVGSMTIDFTDCSNALLSYTITEEALAGLIDIKRAIPGTETLCEELVGGE